MVKLCSVRGCFNLTSNGLRFCLACAKKQKDRRMRRLVKKDSSAGAVRYEEE